MQTRTQDNFSDNRTDFDNLASDLVSRDDRSLKTIVHRVKSRRKIHSVFDLIHLRYQLQLALVREREFGTYFLLNSCFFGIGAILWFVAPVDPPRFLLLPLFIIVTGVSIRRLLQGRQVSLSGSALFALLLGTLAADVETWRKSTIILDTSLTTNVRGTVERREVDHQGIWRYRINLQSTSEPEIRRRPETVLLVARQKHEGYEVGDLIEGRARLSPPSGPVSIGANDFAFNAYFSGYGASGFFYSLPRRIEPQAVWSCYDEVLLCLDRTLYKLRAAIAERIRQIIGGDAGALSASIITDERRAISPDVMDALRQSGLAHIVAISGLNMALAAGTFFVGLRLLFACSQRITEGVPVKKLSAALALMMTLAYYLISGFAVSAERAWIMMSVMLIAIILDRPAISLRNVAISGLIIGFISPSEIMGASFQMSFAATLALVAVYGAWSRRAKDDLDLVPLMQKPLWRGLRYLTYIVAGTILTSLIGGLATAPFSIAYFNQIAPYGLIANLLAMPAMGLLVMPSALVGMLLMPFGLETVFISTMGYGIQMVINIALYVAAWSDDYTIQRLPEWFLPLIVGLLVLSAILRTKLAVLSLIPALMVIAVAGMVTQENPDLIIHEAGDFIVMTDYEKLLSNKTRPPDFVFSNWQRALSLTNKIQPPIIMRQPPKSDEEAASTEEPNVWQPFLEQENIEQAFFCVRGEYCAIRSKLFGTIIQVLNGKLLGQACDLADIIITPIQTRMAKCYSGAMLITGRHLRQSGTLEFYKDQSKPKGYRYETALTGNLRPWTMHRYYDWRLDRYTPISIISDSDG